MQIVNSALLLRIYGEKLSDSFPVGPDELQDGIEEHIALFGQAINDDSDSDRIVRDEAYIQQFIWSTVRRVISKLTDHHNTVQ